MDCGFGDDELYAGGREREMDGFGECQRVRITITISRDVPQTKELRILTGEECIWKANDNLTTRGMFVAPVFKR